MSIRARLFLGFFILIGIFVISFVVNQQLSNEVINNTEYLSHSENVIRNSDRLNKYMIDMQSGFRGYLLTSQESFLDPYQEGLRVVPGLIIEQRKLLTDSEQQKRLDSISVLHTKWVAYANSLITTKQDTLPEAGLRYQQLFEMQTKKEVGKKINDEIRSLFQEFDSDEYNRRLQRREALQQSISRTRQITITLTLFSISIAVIASLYIVHVISLRIKSMVKLAEEISTGKFKTIYDREKDELNNLSKSLNHMSATLEKNFIELKRKNKELDQFAYVVSHDLKAPLRGIDNTIKWMKEDHEQEITPNVKHNLEVIKGRTKRLENMINGLLEYARIGRVSKGLETVDVNLMLMELKDLLVPSGFKFIIEGKMPVFLTEKLRLEQVFSNLISNAVRYHNKENGTIEISSQENMDTYEFSVKDDGPGIHPEYHERIFTIFQTLKERDAFESTGVGLAIVSKILDEQKTSIRIISDGENGTEFKFTWPKRNQNKLKISKGQKNANYEA